MNRELTVFSLLKFILIIAFLPFVLIWYIWARTNWSKAGKISVSAIIAVFFLIVVFSGNSEETKLTTPAENKPVITQQAPQIEADKTTTEKKEEETIQDPLIPEGEIAKVVNIVDGDTIKLENGKVVRYIGIDTPETVHPSKPVQCFGKEASAKNKQLIEGKEVRLVKDVSETDKYGRLLRYVYIGDTFVNDYLVRNGYAHSSTFPPDVKYQDQFKKAEEEARTNKLGLWADNACKTDATTAPATSTTPTPINTPGGSNSGSTGGFACNCSKTCPQMGCAEAQYQLNTCGCTRRDADHDGIACDADCQ